MSDPERPPSGLVAGKYEVVRLIGRGGMGSVWEGKHASLGTKVAIKFIDKEHAESEEARSRFVTEARAAATIETRHAIRIFDHGMTDEGRPYIVMEMLVGEPLDHRIERLGQVSLQETARVLGQVCRALQRAHDAGIIHRDLKPENIFLVRAPDDDDETAKVLDFGIAKIMGPPGEGLTSSTKTGAAGPAGVMGTGEASPGAADTPTVGVTLNTGSATHCFVTVDVVDSETPTGGTAALNSTQFLGYITYEVTGSGQWGETSLCAVPNGWTYTSSFLSLIHISG